MDTAEQSRTLRGEFLHQPAEKTVFTRLVETTKLANHFLIYGTSICFERRLWLSHG